jgi:preprotein translocase subunit YajC
MEIISQLLPFVFLIAIMYFVIIRPQQKEAKARKEMIDALKKGDKVVTNGGFIVVIHKVEEKFLSVKMNDDTLVKITKDSIASQYEDVISKSESNGKA